MTRMKLFGLVSLLSTVATPVFAQSAEAAALRSACALHPMTVLAVAPEGSTLLAFDREWRLEDGAAREVAR